MRTLRYLSRARTDLRQIRRYIETESGDKRVALDFTERLRNQCKRLAELPGELDRARPELRDGLRSFPYGNYVIFFLYTDEFVDIVTIIEGHRDIDALFE